MMTHEEILKAEIEKLKKAIGSYDDLVKALRCRMQDLKEDNKDLQRQVQDLKQGGRLCPALADAHAEIRTLQKSLDEHKKYELNSLMEKSDASNGTMRPGSSEQGKNSGSG